MGSAQVVDIEGEDPEVFDGRFKEWDVELNPAGSNAATISRGEGGEEVDTA